MELNFEFHLFLISVKRHSVRFHADLLLYLVDDCLIFLASFLGRALDKLEVVCGVREDHVDEVYYELHILLHETT